MSSKKAYTEKNKNNRSRRKLALVVLLAAIFLLCFTAVKQFGIRQNDAGDAGVQSGQVSSGPVEAGSEAGGEIGDAAAIDAEHLPGYDGHHYVKVNGNVPEFPDDVYKRASLKKDGDRYKTDGKLTPYEYYGSLDGLGRCTCACGCLGEETMPAEGQERGDISSVHPSGWAKAQNWERCHLIAWALSAENDNPSNLITGTHYLNYDGMRPLEEKVEHYIWDTGNHVLYMALPWFSGDELVARGVQLIARSVEDNGAGISFNVYCFNVIPDASIDYNTGIVTTKEQAAQEARLYVINKRSGVFHYPSCEGAQSMSQHNREEVTATRVELTSKGYVPCGLCEP